MSRGPSNLTRGPRSSLLRQVLFHRPSDALLNRPETETGSVFEKCVVFLQGRFSEMVAFLRYPGTRRNSLAETGIRCLRRLERGHDGFRGADGLDCYLRLYQAVKYRSWAVYTPIDSLGLPAPPDGVTSAAS